MLNQKIRELLQRLAYKLKGDKRYDYFDEIKNNLFKTRTEIIDIQNKNIQKLIKHAYEHTKYYKNVMDSLSLTPNDIQNSEDLKKLPLLTKQIIRNNSELIKSNDNFSENLVKVTSGGSTGMQSVIYKSKYFEEMQRAISIRDNIIADWNPGDKSVWIWGAPYENQEAATSLIKKIGIAINGRLLLNAYKYSEKDFSKWTDAINDFQPRILYGYATIIEHFSKYLLEQKINLYSIQKVVTTSEVLTNRALIEQVFQCKVHNQYGCREILAVAIEDKDEKMYVSDDTVVLNLEDDGKIILTPLHSYGFPLINYKVGDIAAERILDHKQQEKAYPFSLLDLKIGRETDNFINCNGDIISSSAISTYLSTFDLEILEHQFLQKNCNSFIVKYIPKKVFDNKKYKKIVTEVLNKYYGDDINIDFQQVVQIPFEKSGKRLMFKRLF